MYVSLLLNSSAARAHHDRWPTPQTRSAAPHGGSAN